MRHIMGDNEWWVDEIQQEDHGIYHQAKKMNIVEYNGEWMW